MFKIRITQDQMAAWLMFTSDEEVATADIEQGLSEAGVVFGVDTFLLEDLAKAHHANQWYKIAQALPPQEGLAYGFSRCQTRAPKRLQDGRVDFYNLGRIPNVLKGDVLVALVSLEQRAPGRTVTNSVIPPCQDEVSLPIAGMNVGLSEDKRELVALINGYPQLTDDCVHVDVVYTLDGDVDFSTGNVDCISDILITGNIKFGFHVNCKQNVTVFGTVDGSVIEAVGDILLHGHVFGQHKTYIKCGKSVRGSYVDAATIDAQDDIILTNGVRRSLIKSAGCIEVQGANGFIIGGIAQASKRIVTHDLGCESAMPTRVEIIPGLFDDVTLPRFLQHLNEITRDDLDWIQAQIERDTQTASVDEMRRAVEQARLSLSQLTDYFTRHRQVLCTQRVSANCVIVTGTVYPGVIVTMGSASFNVSERMTNVMFYPFDNAIYVRPLDQMDAFVSEWSS